MSSAAEGGSNRDLRVIAGSIGLSAIGDGAALIALALAARMMAGSNMRSGLAVSAVFICLWAPLALLSGHVGLLVDRFEDRALLMIASVGQAVVAIGLAFVHSLAALLVLTVALGVGVSVSQAAEFALVPVAAGKRTLQEANSLVESARAFGFMIGPACGGVLVAAGGTRAAMLVDAASFVVVAGGALVLQARRRVGAAALHEKRRARDGLAFLFSEPTLGLGMVVAFASLLFMSASIPADVLYVKDVLRIGDAAVGLVLTAWTVGMLLGSNVVARRVPLAATAVAAFAGVTLQGIGKAVAPFWQTFAFMAVAYLAGGLGHGLKNVAFRTLIHARVPADRHGRVFAAYSGLRNTAELGALALGGVVVGLVGARWTLWLAGGLSAAVGLAGLGLLRTSDRQRPTTPQHATPQRWRRRHDATVTTPRQCVFLVNPASAAGSTGKHWPEIAHRAAAAGLSGDTLLSERPGQLGELARKAVLGGATLLVAVGGDGTVNEVVNGIADLDEQPEVAIISRGTGWDFIRTFGIPRTVEDAVAVALRGETRLVDLGRVSYRAWDGSDGEAFFANVASAGMSGVAAQRANATTKAFGGKTAYLWAALAVLARWSPGELRVTVDGESRAGRMYDVIVANGRFFGGGMKICPDAEATDGLFDVLTIGDLSKRDLMMTMPKAYRGAHLPHRKAEVLRGRVVTVESNDPVPVELDGEQPGTTPVRFEVLHGRLKLRVPKTTKEKGTD